MPRAASRQLQLFEPEAPLAEGISPVRLAVVRKAVFGNLTTLKRAAPAAIAAPEFAEWERRFVELCAKLPDDERGTAMAAFRLAVERVR